MKKIVAIMMAVVMLAGCSGDKETVLTGKGTANGADCEVQMVSVGDKMSSVKEVVTMDAEKIGATEETLKSTVEPAIENANKMKGVSMKVDIKEGKVILTTELDYSKADIEELKGIGLVDSSSDAKYISLKKSKENYEKSYGVVFNDK